MKLMNKIAPFILAAVILLFLAGLLQLFDLAFEKGDVYPPYSSLRSDPVGGRAFYEAMRALNGISVTRHFKPLTRLPDGGGKTLFIAGCNTSDDPEDLVKALEHFAGGGGRLVLAFHPILESLAATDDAESCGCGSGKGEKSEKECSKDGCKEQKKDGGDGEDGDEKDNPEEDPWFVEYVSIEDRWGFSFATLLPPKSEEGEYLEIEAIKQDGPPEWPQSLSWHSALYFDKPVEQWKTLYAWDGHPVIIERPWLRGTIVLCSDSYLLSNEAMRKERHPEVLAWLVGPSTSVIFDEAHFGIQQQQGVMTLARKYHLDLPLALLALLALLFIWKNASSLAPKHAALSLEENHQGKDSTAGLVNLLRRSIPRGKISQVCVEEWGAVFAHDPKCAAKRGRVKDILERETSLPARQRNPVKTYQTISALLKERD
jgi:hypothetical protein